MTFLFQDGFSDHTFHALIEYFKISPSKKSMDILQQMRKVGYMKIRKGESTVRAKNSLEAN